MKALVAILMLFVSAAGVAAQDDPTWSQPFEPFKVVGNLYYVGTRGLSSYLVVTPAGSILIDTGTEAAVPIVRANIAKLGFKVADIKVMLASHAHFDHVGGHAAMQKATGATVMVLRPDARAVETGKDLSALNGPGWQPATVGRVLNDGETVTLGNVTLTAHLTPGHTQGCTTWETTISEAGKTYRVVFIGGTSINDGVRLVGNTRHPAIAADYGRTFTRLKTLRPDVFVAQHPSIFGMEAKFRKLKAGDPLAFVDPDGYRRFVDEEEKTYQAQLQREQSR
jgi:metallo-beta-lactamase class B